MAHIHRKYIDSHWLTFITKGLFTLLFGWIALFNSGNDVRLLVSFVSIFLLGLSLIEFANSLHRAHQSTGWLVSVLVALFDAGVALSLLFTSNADLLVFLIIIAAYTIIRGICEIVIAFRTTVDPTDRFIWLISGVCGCIIGVVILNSGHLATTDFIRFFGAYLTVLGVCNLIYGMHNHSQKEEDRAARSEAAKTARAMKAIVAAKKSHKKVKPVKTSKKQKKASKK